MDNFNSFCLLNQLDGILPNVHKKYGKLILPCVNAKDICYENSFLGPDAYVVPEAEHMKFPKIVIIYCPLIAKN